MNATIGYIEFEHDALKPLVTIEITSTLKKADHKTYIGLVDTGATHTVLSKKIQEELSLKKMGVINISTGSVEFEQLDLYEIKAKIQGTDMSFIEEGLKAAVSNVNLKGCDVLIGLDVLQYGNLSYDGLRKIFSLTFPNKKVRA